MEEIQTLGELRYCPRQPASRFQKKHLQKENCYVVLTNESFNRQTKCDLPEGKQ